MYNVSMGDKSKRGQRFLVVLTVLILAGIIAAMLVTSTQSGALAEKVAAAKKVGFPFEGKDLVPKFNFPESQNAAPHYLDAKSIERAIGFTKNTAGHNAVGKFPNEMASADRAIIVQYVREYGPVIDEYQKGAAKPYCYFEKDWSKGANVLFPEFADIKTMSRTVLARAYLRANSGDIKGAAADLDSVTRTARHLASQPTLIALLVSVSLEAMEAKTIENLLVAASKDKRLTDALRTQAKGQTDKWDLTNGLRAEAFLLWWCTDHLHDLSAMAGSSPNDEPLLMRLTKNSQTVARAVKSSVLDVYTPALRDYKPFGDERAVLQGVDMRAQRAKAESILAQPYLEVLMAVWSQLPVTFDRARAKKVSLLAALDVIEHRRTHGAWPKSLAEVGAYTDPFDKQPLRYRIDGTGFRVWSVGQNKVDDGGKTRDETKSEDHDEVIVFTPK